METGTPHSSTQSRVTIVDDISKGAAKHPIRVMNNIDIQRKFPHFDYAFEPVFPMLEQSRVKQMPKRRFCECNGDCTEENGCLCVHMSTVKLLKSNRVQDADQLDDSNPFNSTFCECTADCACAGKCGNRLAPEDGKPKHELEIFRKKHLGYTCRALKPIRKGSFVCFLAGEVVFNLVGMPENSEHFCFTFKDMSRQQVYKIRMDRVANEARFFNSNCCPNLVPVCVYREFAAPDYPRIAFVARNEINADEELSFFYGNHWLLSNLTENPKFVCLCGSPYFCAWPSVQKEDLRRPEQLAKKIRDKIAAVDEQRGQDRHDSKKRKLLSRRSKGSRETTMEAESEMETEK